MIVDNQQNIKIHFAGCEQVDFWHCLSNAGINYNLFSVFGLISKKVGIQSYSSPIDPLLVPGILTNDSKHTIMDSGLFTLMFGSHSGEKDYKFLNMWYNCILDFISESGYKGTCVEVDCQKVLGVEKAWEFRKRMRNDTKNRIINVFHFEDGKKGLDEMIEFSDYIAVSVPELRAIGKKEYLKEITYYIKNKKPSIDIHLLGCTELDALKELNFASSADSTSWNAINQFGRIGNKNDGFFITNDSNHKTLEKYREKSIEIATKYKKSKLTEKRILYFSRYLLAGEYYRDLYERYAGDQS